MKKVWSLVLALVMCLGLTVPAFAANAPRTSAFTDVSANAYYAKPVAWAVEQGITKGTTSTTFSPGDSCTIAQILTFLWRSAGRPGAASANMAWKDELSAVVSWAKTKGINDPYLNGYCGRDKAVEYMWRAAGCPEPTVTAKFEDVSPYASYTKAVSWALEKGITNGTGSLTFSPSQICSRGDIATFLYREAVEPLKNVTLPSRDAMLAEFVSLINEERAKEGLSPVTTYSTLTAAAQLRSAEVAQSVSHTRPNGTDYTTALAETGADQNVSGSYELVMGGPTSPSYFINSCMMNSPNYKEAILNPEFTHVGVGYTYYSSGKYRNYWSVIFTRVDGDTNNAQASGWPQATPTYGDSGLLYSTDSGISLTLWENYVNARIATSYSVTATAVNFSPDWLRVHGSNFTVSWSVDDPSLLTLEEVLYDGVPRQVKITGEKAGNAKITCKVTAHDGYVAEAYCYIEVRPRGAATTTPTTPSTSGMTAEQMCARVVELVNQERAKQGLSPLSTMPSLTAAANIRAPELVTLFSHNRPDGTQCFTAFKEAKVTGYFTAGENIAAGYSTPEAVMNGWMNSPGHRANILTADFTHIGVGYYNGCWVQMFIGVR